MHGRYLQPGHYPECIGNVRHCRGHRPDCNAFPRTYDEAYALCDNNGYRLCTKSEMESDITEAEGCNFDHRANWVSTECGDTQTNTAETTADPTTAQPTTAQPTTAEPTTAEPTTAEPTTAQPTPSQCPSADMYGVNWHDLVCAPSTVFFFCAQMSYLRITLDLFFAVQLNEDVSTDVLLHDSDVEFDAGSLSLTFSASLEYIGLSADGNFDHDYNLGMMSTRIL